MRPTDGASRFPRSHSFPKEVRLRKRREFLALRHTGKRMRSKNFLFVRHLAGEVPVQLGITVTKKIGGAVARNRIKRGVREGFRHIREKMPLGGKVLVIAQRGSADLLPREIQAEIQAILLAEARS
ncbi:MAG: ribonuclease P protein component [Candidatus Binatia bacterium]|nr:ribonuclease P protein component [Candidatus Binatia bacterium]MDG1959488.1 ribonuclease P protein component [Candidatus Binatia bacterium]MDG2010450.1 ribonuclease P protein component [Candidatus Binatia bacterium]